jgi:hypothetical protein
MSTMYVNNIAPLEGNTINVASGNTLYAPGSVVQVVSTDTQDTTSYTTAAGTYSDILSLAITPSSATSKILIQSSITVGSDTYSVHFRVLKDGSTISNLIAAVNESNHLATFAVPMFASETSQDDNIGTAAFSGVDTAGTTSEITYKIQGTLRAVGNWRLNAPTDTATNANRGRGVSTLTLMEIAQ